VKSCSVLGYNISNQPQKEFISPVIGSATLPLKR